MVNDTQMSKNLRGATLHNDHISYDVWAMILFMKTEKSSSS